jgi:flagellar motor switch protein FliN/FliY
MDAIKTAQTITPGAAKPAAPAAEPPAPRVALEVLEPTAPSGPPVLGKAAVERVPVTLSVELGRTQIAVKDLRQLRQAQVVVLDQMIGEPLSVFANGHRIAFGEVVAVGKDQYGIRITALAEEVDPTKEGAA